MKKTYGRPLYSPREAYRILYCGMRAFPYLRHAVRGGVITEEFKERLMLAVTEVNGCALCAYGHTRMALESGMSRDEIRAMLGGELSEVPEDELPAVLFAQHYAESRGLPSEGIWKQIEQLYGRKKAYAILSAIRVIMAGNAYGIPMGSLACRLMPAKREKIDKRSGAGYEACMLLTVFPFAVAAFFQAVAAENRKLPFVTFPS